MAVDLDIRSIESSVADEIYISAKPKSASLRPAATHRGERAQSSRGGLQEQACEIFSGIADNLRSKNACILRERIFTPKKPAEELLRLRSQIYGELDDGVAATILVGKPESTGPITAVQVHAICSDSRPEVIDVEGRPAGRILRVPGCTYLTLSSISAGQFDKATEQARAMMEKAESALKQFNSDFFSVARTWMWLGRILSWYGSFNRVRNKFFTERGLIPPAATHRGEPAARLTPGPLDKLGAGSVPEPKACPQVAGLKTRGQSMPASTGIGLRPTPHQLYISGGDRKNRGVKPVIRVNWCGGSKCAMDLIAVLEPRDSIQHLQAAGRQQCALEYGSAFSRASRAITPAGETIFVSGTASIDASGATTHIDDPLGQIKETIKNVRAVLKDTHVTDEDVVQAVAYCKTTEVEQIFNDLGSRGAGSLKSTIAWPWVTVICDICRPELLFEVEATALKAAKTR